MREPFQLMRARMDSVEVVAGMRPKCRLYFIGRYLSFLVLISTVLAPYRAIVRLRGGE